MWMLLFCHAAVLQRRAGPAADIYVRAPSSLCEVALLMSTIPPAVCHETLRCFALGSGSMDVVGGQVWFTKHWGL